MATECETTGIIVKTLKHICVVSLTLDGIPHSCPFTKEVFYTFGIKCEGDMNNLLDNGMEVEVCYVVRPGIAPAILAVWLGDKPDLSETRCFLKPIYNRKGVVTLKVNAYTVESDDGTVLFKEEVVYRDGQPSYTIPIDEEVSFDAIPLQSVHFSGASYETTCAWIGQKPSIVNRFSLRAEETVPEIDVVVGVVEVIPNDAVALVDVKIDAVAIKVLLFRSSFEPVCDRIQDVVRVGDPVCMRLSYGCLFPGRKQWFAQIALKAGEGMNIDLLESCESPAVTSNANAAEAAVPSKASVLPTVETTHYDKTSEVLYSDPPLSAVISEFSSFACIQYGNLSILVNPCNFYAGGVRADDQFFDSYIASGKNTVNFEAVLIRPEEQKLQYFTHEATCAWIGKKPSLDAIAASLPPSNFELLKEKNQEFFGIVSRICFPKVALVEIPGISTVIVHVKSFVDTQTKDKQELISSFVKLGDCVYFKVKRILRWPQVLNGYDVRIEGSKKISNLVCAGFVSRKPLHPSMNREEPELVNRIPETSTSSREEAVCVASAFKQLRTSEHSFLIGCSGTLKVRCDEDIKSNWATVEHVFGSSKLDHETVFVREGRHIQIQSLKSLNDHKVCFDAQTVVSSNSNSNFIVRRMWETGGKRPPAEYLLRSELILLEGVSTRMCPGEITSIPLHDAAIATVKNDVRVLVPFDSLVTLQGINLGRSSIDTILNVGDFVGLKFEKRDFSGEISGSYYKAVSCWSLSKGGAKITFKDEIRACTPRVNSWFSKWGYGAFFKKGPVLKKGHDRYFVHFTSKKPHFSQDLDIFEKGTVYVNGEPVTVEEFRGQEKEPITYHVAHEYVDKVSDEEPCETSLSKKMFVAWSWIGTEPSPEKMLKHQLIVHKGIVHSNWCYEVVVDSFPLPTHAICALGHSRVLVPLPPSPGNGNFASVEDVNLKRGDRVVVTVLEKQLDDSSILVSNDSSVKKLDQCDCSDVLKNVAGRVCQLPNPTGLIKAYSSNLMVSFELCHVQRLGGSKDKRKMYEGLKEHLLYKKVKFSAVKVNAKTAPYRAFEVFL